MIREVTEQGAGVAREHYGARGWVVHQNTDIWRVAAPMDGPSWGAFTTGGAWLCHAPLGALPVHRRPRVPARVLPGHEGVGGVLPRLSRARPASRLARHQSVDVSRELPARSGQRPVLRRGHDVHEHRHDARRRFDDRHADPERSLRGGRRRRRRRSDVDADFRAKLLGPRARLAPMQVGSNGDLQEWLEDWGQREKSHRHISALYGLYPGSPDLRASNAGARRGERRRAGAARARGQRLVVSVESRGVGASRQRRRTRSRTSSTP